MLSVSPLTGHLGERRRQFRRRPSGAATPRVQKLNKQTGGGRTPSNPRLTRETRLLFPWNTSPQVSLGDLPRRTGSGGTFGLSTVFRLPRTMRTMPARRLHRCAAPTHLPALLPTLRFLLFGVPAALVAGVTHPGSSDPRRYGHDGGRRRKPVDAAVCLRFRVAAFS